MVDAGGGVAPTTKQQKSLAGLMYQLWLRL
jgi:hypothetical protein